MIDDLVQPGFWIALRVEPPHGQNKCILNYVTGVFERKAVPPYGSADKRQK
jgi:hypothetical protein